ncbi:MAG: hypothetical protein NTV80_24585 [Verrucomicrobia bacterium]|nr:hypothetical protein [Verrucomicrobiota bacterium]
MPVSADSTTLPFLERFSREAWTWSPAILLLSLALMGQWLSLFPLPSPEEDPPKPTAEEVERSLATPHLDSPERLPGRPFETFLLRTRDGIQLPASMRKMREKPHTDTFSNPVWWVGFFGFVLLFSVEDIFGIPGSMSRLVQSLRSPDTQAAAPPVLMLSCVAAMGTCWAGSPVFATPPTLRCALSWLCKGASWAVIIVSLVATTLAINLPGLPVVNSADIFTHPVTALWAGLPPMLCALSLWLLGHIFRTPNDPLPHA